MVLLISSTLNFSSAMRRLRLPINGRLSRLSMHQLIALAKDFGSLTGTRNPLYPSTTVSLQPGTLVVMTGRPTAKASKVLLGMPSRYEGSMNTEHFRKNGLTSFVAPKYSITPILLHSSNVSCICCAALDANPCGCRTGCPCDLCRSR